MVGMLQVLTYMFAFYLVLKGVELYLLARPRPGESDKKDQGTGLLLLIVCIIAAGAFVFMQESQAAKIADIGSSLPLLP
jgi:hypothetical protein